nr:RNA-directed DNA polymerase, eukaryota [Tanacetum cinerariifolium]
MLWSYSNHMIDGCSGETIIMGDFNEVRSKEERFSTIFNNHNASVFNSFISSGGLVEVPLGGCEFTWCHKSDSKMSKLDRFLSSEGLMRSCPNISAITLDHYLSNHRPILLREACYDYAPIPFRMFHYWFDSPNSSRLMLDMDFPNRVSVEQLMDLERNVLKEEIKRAVWDCSSDKSPGPDGFTFGFYRRYWDNIENDVVDAVSYFFTIGMFPKGGNASFIALIPKMQDSRVVKDFRPISLISRVYKIIAKILANHLVGVLGDLIHEVQSTFIANRQILDGPFILYELIHWCRSKKKQAMIFKVDFEKAYDSVRLDYLDGVLNKFGFGSKWRTWIRNCLVSSKGSILVNGSPTSEFYFRKGLKQDMFKGISVSSSLQLSHLFYADDVIFMGQWSESNINTIIQALDCFYKASGLRMNLHKSKLMGISVKDEAVSRAAIKMGCSTLKTPFTYLDIRVGGSMARIRSWDEIMDKVKSQLSNWKMNTLSIGGRMTLLKSVLSSTLIYYMSMFKVPSQVLKCLEGIRRKFFIGADLKENKMSWFKWNKVLTSKDKGGLGVSSLFVLNRALLFKWGLDKRSKAAHTSVWKSIITEVNNLRNKGVDLLNFMNKKITVTSKMNHNDVGLSLRRALSDGVELEQFNSLNVFLAGTMLSDSNDRWSWSLVGSGEFLVASVRKLINKHRLGGSSHETRWIHTVPIKINILV